MGCTPCQQKRSVDESLCDRCKKNERNFFIRTPINVVLKVCKECLRDNDKVLASLYK